MREAGPIEKQLITQEFVNFISSHHLRYRNSKEIRKAAELFNEDMEKRSLPYRIKSCFTDFPTGAVGFRMYIKESEDKENG